MKDIVTRLEPGVDRAPQVHGARSLVHDSYMTFPLLRDILIILSVCGYTPDSSDKKNDPIMDPSSKRAAASGNSCRITIAHKTSKGRHSSWL